MDAACCCWDVQGQAVRQVGEQALLLSPHTPGAAVVPTPHRRHTHAPARRRRLWAGAGGCSRRTPGTHTAAAWVGSGGWMGARVGTGCVSGWEAERVCWEATCYTPAIAPLHSAHASVPPATSPPPAPPSTHTPARPLLTARSRCTSAPRSTSRPWLSSTRGSLLVADCASRGCDCDIQMRAWGGRGGH